MLCWLKQGTKTGVLFRVRAQTDPEDSKKCNPEFSSNLKDPYFLAYTTVVPFGSQLIYAVVVMKATANNITGNHATTSANNKHHVTHI